MVARREVDEAIFEGFKIVAETIQAEADGEEIYYEITDLKTGKIVNFSNFSLGNDLFYVMGDADFSDDEEGEFERKEYHQEIQTLFERYNREVK